MEVILLSILLVVKAAAVLTIGVALQVFVQSQVKGDTTTRSMIG